jgi:CubicO group peptidase (beta-lactamase class C family)
MKRARNLFLFLLIWPIIIWAEQTKDYALANPLIPLEQTITEGVNNFIKENKINISYLVEKEDGIITSGASGFFDLNKKIELKPDTIFPTAAISQSFAAATALLLKEQGKIKMSDPISKYFPSNSKYWGSDKAPDWADRVTIHHLLTHSHGIPEFYEYTMLRKRKFPGVLKKFVDSLSKVKLEFVPGSRASFSNSGYLILEAILEQQLGLKLDEYYKKEFFDKLGMKNTFSVIPSLQDHVINPKYYEANLPVKYILRKSVSDPNDIEIKLSDRNYENADMRILDTGIFSNPEDLNKWQKALHGGKILSKKSYELMIKPYYSIKSPNDNIVSHAGYGIIISRNVGKITFYQQMSDYSGIRAEMIYIPSKNIFMTMLSNMNLDKLAIKKYQNKESKIADLFYLRDAIFEEIRKHIQIEAVIQRNGG